MTRYFVALLGEPPMPQELLLGRNSMGLNSLGLEDMMMDTPRITPGLLEGSASWQSQTRRVWVCCTETKPSFSGSVRN